MKAYRIALIFVMLFLIIVSCNQNQGIKTTSLPRNVEELASSLKDPDVNTRLRAAGALADMGPAAAQAVPDLVQALSDVREVRGFAADALGEIGPDAASAVPELVNLLYDDWFGNRESAAIALGKIGKAARDAISDLEKVLATDMNSRVRASAATAIGQIGDTEGLETLLKSLIEDENESVRRNCAISIAMLGPEVRNAIPTLVLALDDKELYVRYGAAYAISTILDISFPGMGGTDGYTLNSAGESLTVLAAREWWELEGKYLDWEK